MRMPGRGPVPDSFMSVGLAILGGILLVMFLSIARNIYESKVHPDTSARQPRPPLRIDQLNSRGMTELVVGRRENRKEGEEWNQNR